MYRVLLVSFVNWDSLIEIPALLANGGCTVDVFSTPDSWPLKNRFFSNWIPGSSNENEFVAELLKYVNESSGKYRWIVPGDDVVLRLLNECITSEAAFYKLMPLSKIENRQLLGSKAGFSNLCAKYGIRTPKYLIYRDGMSGTEICRQMPFPLMMKVDKSEGGYGVFLCEHEGDVDAHLLAIANKDNLVFQQFIKGYDVNVEVLFRDGLLLEYNYSQTLKIMGKFGVSTKRMFYENPEIVPDLVKMGQDLGLNGFGNVVFMFDTASNTHYLIEIDLRPNAWMYYGRFTGHDFSKAIHKLISPNLLTGAVPSPAPSQKTIISLYKKDLHRCIQEKDYKGLWEWVTNKDGRWKYIPFYDRKLFFACSVFLYKVFAELLKLKLKKMSGRKSA